MDPDRPSSSGKRKLTREGEGIYSYILKDGTVRFEARVKHHNRDWRKFGFLTISQAKKWRQSRVGAIADGRLFPEIIQQAEKARQKQETPNVTFQTYTETWMKAKRASGLKFTTLIRYQSMLKVHLVPAFGSLPLIAVDRGKVRDFVAQLSGKRLKSKSIKNVLLGLSAIYTDAIEDGHVQHNPAQKTAKLIKTAKRSEDVVAFTHEEEWRILETAQLQYPHYYSFILLLFRTGMREGEAVALRPEDLDFRKRCVWVQRNFTSGQLSNSPKSRQRRSVDLSQDLITVLKDYLTVREAEAMMNGRSLEGWLFTSPQGEIIRSNNFRDRVWKPLLKAAGLPYRWVHATRHTFASRLIMGGANVVYVQKQLGHSSIQLTVDTYTHWMRQSERQTSLEVDRLIHPPPEEPGGTFGGTLVQEKSEPLKTKEEKWGE